MAKILIATLGTGRAKKGKGGGESERSYKMATYRIDDGIEYTTPFVAAALIEELKVDKIILVGTARSIWEDVYGYFIDKSNQKIDENYWLYLVEKVTSGDNANLIMDNDLSKTNKVLDDYIKHLRNDAVGGSKCVVLEYGLNTTELWRNFEIFMEIEKLFEQGDEIYLDITHAFRSIPIFMYLMMDFINTLQSGKIKLSGIYYGMLEVTGELGYAPVVNLEPLFTMSKWIRATHNFVNYGNGFLMAELIKNTELQKTITNISQQTSINYLVELRREIKDLDRKIKDLEENNIEEAVFTYMIPALKEFINRFSNLNTDSNFQLAVARWYFDNKVYSNGYICMAESVITKLCEIYGLDIAQRRNRKLIKTLTWRKNNPFKGRDEHLDKLLDIYFEINPIRNKIAHASFDTYVKIQNRNEKLNHKTDISDINDYYTRLKKVLNSDRLKQLPKIISLSEIRNVKRHRHKRY